MRLDYHVHTRLCKHASGEPAEYVERALALGLAELGFSDHNPMPGGYDPLHRMEEPQFPDYIRMIEEVQEQYSDYPIRLGLEADFHAGTEAYVAETLKRYPFDYVIGSVHYLAEWGFDQARYREEFDRRDIDWVYEQYAAIVRAMARSGLYDIAGHLDLVKIFGHRARGDMTEVWRATLEELRKAGMSLEANTAGFRRPIDELYPAPDLVKMASQLGVPITLGSDAHQPAQVGWQFDEAVRVLYEAGYRELVAYRRREPVAVPLD